MKRNFFIFVLITFFWIRIFELREVRADTGEIGVAGELGGVFTDGWSQKKWYFGFRGELNFTYYFTANLGLRFLPTILYTPLEPGWQLETFGFPVAVVINLPTSKDNFISFSPGIGIVYADLERYGYHHYGYYGYHYEFEYNVDSDMGIMFGGSVEFKKSIGGSAFLNFGISVFYLSFQKFPNEWFVAPRIGLSANF